MGTYFGEQTADAIANTRAMGAVLGGLLGGPVTGFLVGITGGLHRYSVGGFTDLACAISTTLEGLSAGLVSYYFRSKGQIEKLFMPSLAFAVTLFAVALQMLLIVLVAEPLALALDLVQQIALPMLIVNALGAALFMSMVRDQKTMFDKLSSSFSTKALKIAERSVGVLSKGFNQQTSAQMAQIIIEETKVGAVAITDKDKLLAFIGIGAEHHIPGAAISSQLTLDALTQNKVMFADGVDTRYACSLSSHCKLGSCLVIPLHSDTEVIGTIKLYEPKKKLFLNINRTLGEGIAKLLSNQILYGQLEAQQNLLVQAELKLLQAQVNPHFLFNALNTISAIMRKDPTKARTLLLQLAQFLRINLKRTTGLISLSDELDHIDNYLTIEKARFSDKLTVTIDIPTEFHQWQLPAFTLQPIIENAVKHGTSQLLSQGIIHIRAWQTEHSHYLSVEDNAGLYQPQDDHQGLGMTLVDKRLKNQFGQEYGLTAVCNAQHSTLITIKLPADRDTV